MQQILRLLDLEENNSNFKIDNNKNEQAPIKIENNFDEKQNNFKVIFSEANINSFCSISNG